MRTFGLLIILLSAAACGVANQPLSSETVAAFEVPLPTANDRAAILTIVRDVARAEGGHVDADSDCELREIGAAMPLAQMTIHAAVWRGSNDEESWATIMDQDDHLGQVWIMFSRGENEALSSQFRTRVMRTIKARWPGTLSLPIFDRRTIPLHDDLVKTPEGYRINPSAASKHDGKRAF